ncbi:MAG: hypothetical protein Q9187_000182 [Circinaria calcarea]
MDPTSVADQSLRRIFCDFLASSLLIILARQEQHFERQMQHYLDARKHAKTFRSHLQNQDQLEGGAKDDLLRKAKTLNIYDFEAAIRLKAWHDIGQLLEEIVNASWQLEGADMIKLSRWIRCLFQLTLPSKLDFTEHLLDQVQTLAGDIKKVPLT